MIKSFHINTDTLNYIIIKTLTFKCKTIVTYVFGFCIILHLNIRHNRPHQFYNNLPMCNLQGSVDSHCIETRSPCRSRPLCKCTCTYVRLPVREKWCIRRNDSRSHKLHGNQKQKLLPNLQ